jgi:hypothetical protein
MKKLVLAGLTCAGLMALLPESGMAHGGQYRGPGDVTPPSPGGGRGTGGPSGPTTGGPAGPSTPGPGGPATPGAGGPATGGPAGPAGRGPATGGRGVVLDDDLSRWEFWWEFNKDPFIRLKEAVRTGAVQTGSDDFFLGATRKVEAKDTLKPSQEDNIQIILPALKKAIDSTDNRDIASSCMVAMAKIGTDHPDFKLADVFSSRLKKNDQEIRETAALAYGIAALPNEDNVKLLIDLAKDGPLGRKACDQTEIAERTRAFAAYGLGLIAYANSSLELKAQILQALREALAEEKSSARQIKVAAINAISLLNVSGSSDKEKTLVNDAVKVLSDYYAKELGTGEQLIQAHCPPAIAKLIGREHEKSAEFKKLFADELQEKTKSKRSNILLSQSCALALGQLCKSADTDKDEDAKYSKVLLDAFHENKDAQTRFFSILALGQIGGQINHDVLLKEFEKSKKQDKGWVAISMGVFAFKRYDAANAKGTTPEPERAFGEVLKAAFEAESNPAVVSGIAVALGLCKYQDAADMIRENLKKTTKEDVAGYLCISLALMNDTRSTEDIRTIVQKSVRKPDLLKQAAVALGKLGDKNAAEELQKMMSEGQPVLAKLSAIASALGYIGDRRTIDPLKTMLFDDKLPPLSRAFAAVALGGVADKENMPWNSKIGCNMNYRASVETLTDKNAGTGILDIL